MEQTRFNPDLADVAQELEMSEGQKGKRSDRLAYMGALAGGLAHEIRNPLSTINLNLQLMAEEWEGMDSDRARRAKRKIEILQHEASRLEEILNNFLQVARGQDLSLQRTQINQTLEELLDFVTPELEEAGVVNHRGLSPSLPEVDADRTLIKQALINIIRNGKEAMEGEGEMMVRSSHVGETIQIEIIDTGIGIPPDKLERIFDPYFTTKRTGTGLGLATTKRIIEDHGGDIHCDSEPGKGTRFEIRLPIASDS
jgi:signal transduction histidine kinase